MLALCPCAVSFADDAAEYVIVGSAYVYEEEEEASKGRIIVYSVFTDGAAATGDGESNSVAVSMACDGVYCWCCCRWRGRRSSFGANQCCVNARWRVVAG